MGRPRQDYQTVFCPTCKRTFRAQISRRWAKRESRRSFGYPLLPCVECMRAEGRGGGRNPELEAR